MCRLGPTEVWRKGKLKGSEHAASRDVEVVPSPDYHQAPMTRLSSKREARRDCESLFLDQRRTRGREFCEETRREVSSRRGGRRDGRKEGKMERTSMCSVPTRREGN